MHIKDLAYTYVNTRNHMSSIGPACKYFWLSYRYNICADICVMLKGNIQFHAAHVKVLTGTVRAAHVKKRLSFPICIYIYIYKSKITSSSRYMPRASAARPPSLQRVPFHGGWLTAFCSLFTVTCGYVLQLFFERVIQTGS